MRPGFLCALNFVAWPCGPLGDTSLSMCDIMNLTKALQLDPSTADAESLRLALKALKAARASTGADKSNRAAEDDGGKATAAAAANSSGGDSLLSLDQLRAMLRREDELRMSQEVQEAYRGGHEARAGCPMHSTVWHALVAGRGSPVGLRRGKPPSRPPCVHPPLCFAARPQKPSCGRTPTGWR